MARNSHFQIGLAALALSLFLVLVGIPYGVTSPSNVPKMVLSPVFWPYVLCGVLALTGVGLIVTASFAEAEPVNKPAEMPGGYLRLALLGILGVLYVGSIGTLGMVWASVLAFIALAFLIKTRHPVVALIAAVLVPLALYAFFAHVAGVAIPQGDFVRMP